jgi:hypothetical protein
VTTSKNTGQFGKGNPGKPKGAINKTTGEVKAMVLAALERAGGVEYLEARANDPRTAVAFLTLVGKVLPMQVTGPDGGDMKLNVTVKYVKPRHGD